MRLISVFFLIFMCLSGACFNETATAGERKADSLFLAGDFFEASVFYERLAWESQSPHDRIRYRLSKAQAQKQLGAFEAMQLDLQSLLPLRMPDSMRMELLRELALASHMQARYAESMHYVSMSKQLIHEDRTDAGIFFIEAMGLLRMEAYPELDSLVKTSFSGSAEAMPADLRSEWETAMNDALNRKLKQERRARLWSSFIPGSGHLYAGFPAQGLLNAGSQAVSLGGFALMALNGYYISGFVLGLGMFQAFYFGGIRQAGHLARQQNALITAEHQNELATLLQLMKEQLALSSTQP